MTLSTNKPYSKPFYGKGIFINEAVIVSIADVSGTTPHPLTSSVDIGVRLTLEVGKDFRPEMLIAGSFKRNESGEVLGWGSAFPIQELFSKLGYNGTLNPDNSIPDEALETMLGKRFLRLSYVSGEKINGKPHYSDWNIIATPEEGADTLAKRFHASLEKGYPRNYRPEVLDTTPAENTSTTDTSIPEGGVF